MTPTAPGVYTLRLPDGDVRRRVRDINGELFVIVPGRIWLFSAVAPLEQVAGEWVVEQETA